MLKRSQIVSLITQQVTNGHIQKLYHVSIVNEGTYQISPDIFIHYVQLLHLVPMYSLELQS